MPARIRGLYVPGRRPVILVSEALDLDEQTFTLGHELVHDEWNGGCILTGMPAQYLCVGAREERRVDLEVTRRMAPLDQLEEIHNLTRLNDVVLERWQVAEEFRIPERAAVMALQLLELERPQLAIA